MTVTKYSIAFSTDHSILHSLNDSSTQFRELDKQQEEAKCVTGRQPEDCQKKSASCRNSRAHLSVLVLGGVQLTGHRRVKIAT